MVSTSFYNFFYIINILCKNGAKYLWYHNDMKFIKDITYDIEKMNIVYVKILQAICINSFIFNQRQIDYLIKYTDQVPYTQEDVDLTFIDQFEDKDLHITNITPINSGIIALVYDGMYKEQRVVIKVIKKNIIFQLKNAMDDVDFICWLFSYIPYIKTFKLDKLYKNNREIIMNQVDFKLEMENLRAYKTMNKNIDYLDSPEVYEEFTNINPNILVMEYVDGIKYKDIKDEDKDGFAELMGRIAFMTIVFHRMGHGDLHAGNILFSKNGPKRIILIDFGIVCKITKGEQQSLYEFFKEIYINKDYYNGAKFACSNLISPINAINKLSDKHRDTLYTKWGKIIKEHWIEDFSVEFLSKCNQLLSEYDLCLSKGFSQIQLCLVSSTCLGMELGNGNIKKHQDLLATTINELYNIPEIFIPE
jgi:predicted unusual protein kinase regulating ubiquinone biosynthesis (AarF/ABC1/UbiB family)